MKKNRFFVYAFFGMLAYVNFTSCSNDDKDEPFETPKPSVEKRLASITEKYRNYDPGQASSRDELTTIDYDSNGRIISVTIERDDYKHTKSYSYSENAITVSDHNIDKYTLENGLITKWEESTNYDNPNETTVWTFKYDNGRLIKWSRGDEETTTFKWNNSNITETSNMSDGYHKQSSYQYYSNYDFGGINALYQSDSILFDDLDANLVMQGYFGKLPAQLLKSVHQKAQGPGYSDVYTDDFTYQFDDDGYPTIQQNITDSGISISLHFTWNNK